MLSLKKIMLIGLVIIIISAILVGFYFLFINIFEKKTQSKLYITSDNGIVSINNLKKIYGKTFNENNPAYNLVTNEKVIGKMINKINNDTGLNIKMSSLQFYSPSMNTMILQNTKKLKQEIIIKENVLKNYILKYLDASKNSSSMDIRNLSKNTSTKSFTFLKSVSIKFQTENQLYYEYFFNNFISDDKSTNKLHIIPKSAGIFGIISPFYKDTSCDCNLCSSFENNCDTMSSNDCYSDCKNTLIKICADGKIYTGNMNEIQGTCISNINKNFTNKTNIIDIRLNNNFQAPLIFNNPYNNSEKNTHAYGLSKTQFYLFDINPITDDYGLFYIDEKKYTRQGYSNFLYLDKNDLNKKVIFPYYHTSLNLDNISFSFQRNVNQTYLIIEGFLFSSLFKKIKIFWDFIAPNVSFNVSSSTNKIVIPVFITTGTETPRPRGTRDRERYRIIDVNNFKMDIEINRNDWFINSMVNELNKFIIYYNLLKSNNSHEQLYKDGSKVGVLKNVDSTPIISENKLYIDAKNNISNIMYFADSDDNKINNAEVLVAERSGLILSSTEIMKSISETIQTDKEIKNIYYINKLKRQLETSTNNKDFNKNLTDSLVYTINENIELLPEEFTNLNEIRNKFQIIADSSGEYASLKTMVESLGGGDVPSIREEALKLISKNAAETYKKLQIGKNIANIIQIALLSLDIYNIVNDWNSMNDIEKGFGVTGIVLSGLASIVTTITIITVIFNVTIAASTASALSGVGSVINVVALIVVILAIFLLGQPTPPPVPYEEYRNFSTIFTDYKFPETSSYRFSNNNLNFDIDPISYTFASLFVDNSNVNYNSLYQDIPGIGITNKNTFTLSYLNHDDSILKNLYICGLSHILKNNLNIGTGYKITDSNIVNELLSKYNQIKAVNKKPETINDILINKRKTIGNWSVIGFYKNEDKYNPVAPNYKGVVVDEQSCIQQAINSNDTVVAIKKIGDKNYDCYTGEDLIKIIEKNNYSDDYDINNFNQFKVYNSFSYSTNSINKYSNLILHLNTNIQDTVTSENLGSNNILTWIDYKSRLKAYAYTGTTEYINNGINNLPSLSLTNGALIIPFEKDTFSYQDGFTLIMVLEKGENTISNSNLQCIFSIPNLVVSVNDRVEIQNSKWRSFDRFKNNYNFLSATGKIIYIFKLNKYSSEQSFIYWENNSIKTDTVKYKITGEDLNFNDNKNYFLIGGYENRMIIHGCWSKECEQGTQCQSTAFTNVCTPYTNIWNDDTINCQTGIQIDTVRRCPIRDDLTECATCGGKPQKTIVSSNFTGKISEIILYDTYQNNDITSEIIKDLTSKYFITTNVIAQNLNFRNIKTVLGNQLLILPKPYIYPPVKPLPFNSKWIPIIYYNTRRPNQKLNQTLLDKCTINNINAGLSYNFTGNSSIITPNLYPYFFIDENIGNIQSLALQKHWTIELGIKINDINRQQSILSFRGITNITNHLFVYEGKLWLYMDNSKYKTSNLDKIAFNVSTQSGVSETYFDIRMISPIYTWPKSIPIGVDTKNFFHIALVYDPKITSSDEGYVYNDTSTDTYKVYINGKIVQEYSLQSQSKPYINCKPPVGSSPIYSPHETGQTLFESSTKTFEINIGGPVNNGGNICNTGLQKVKYGKDKEEKDCLSGQNSYINVDTATCQYNKDYKDNKCAICKPEDTKCNHELISCIPSGNAPGLIGEIFLIKIYNYSLFSDDIDNDYKEDFVKTFTTGK